MLDQNTDRMWYVIGAVIIGAALIFLMNGTFPGLLGTIGATFEQKVEQTETMVKDIAPGQMTDGVKPVVPNPNLIPDSDNIKIWAYPGARTELFSNGWTRVPLPTTAIEFGSDKGISVSPDTEYTQSLTIKTDANVLQDVRVTFFNPGVGHVVVDDTTATRVGENEWRIVGTGKTSVDQVRMRVPDVYVTFDGGTYAEFGEFKVEHGTVATPWVR